MRFGLMFFAASEDVLAADKYRLVIESAKFGDRHRFSSIWVPERHFTKLGSLYPNPAVLQAAIARETSRIQLRAGSVVLPLHHPIRVAEEWAVVDNLSGGRVGVSFASGWNPNDFAFFPERYQHRHAEMVAAIQTVQQLWQGEPVTITSGTGEQAAVRIYPTPVQPKLPVWVTAAGNPQTFITAGRIGANLLTHVLDQSIETLAENIQLYRQALADHGHDANAGVVTVMVHTFVGADVDLVREQAREPYCQYLKSNIGLLKGLAQSRGQSFDITSMPPEDIDAFVNLLYDRFATTRGLIGTPDTCLDVVRQLADAGVDELACLLDFGPDAELILQSLPQLQQLKERSEAAQIQRSQHGSAVSIARAAQPQTARVDRLEDIQSRCSESLSVSGFYDQLGRHGVQMHTAFQGIQRLWRHDREALGLLQLPDVLVASASDYTLHPAFFDACLQVFIAALPPTMLSEHGSLYLPVGLRSLRVDGRLDREVWSHAVIEQTSDRAEAMFEGCVRVFDAAGKLVVAVDGLRLQRMDRAQTPVAEHLDSWLYDIRWHPRPLPVDTDTPGQAGRWLIFADRSGVGAELSTHLQARGATCVTVTAGDSYSSTTAEAFEIDPAQPEHMQRLLGEVLASGPLHGIVHLWSLDIAPPDTMTVATLERDQDLGVVSALHLLQTLHTRSSAATRLWLVTRGAQPVAPSDALPALAQSPLWGLGRALPLEFPRLPSGLIDLDSAVPPAEASAQLCAALWHADHEDQIALRAGQRLVARLEHDRTFEMPQQGLDLRPDATYLITGGLGNLGLSYARWMVEHGARYLVLLGRSGAAEAARETLDQMERQGAQVLVARADVADAAAMSSLFDELATTMPPIRGIVHAAGVTSYQTIDQMDTASLRAMLRPKVSGTWLLYQLCQPLDLDFFVCISSLSPVWGTKGLGHYAAANHFLDIFGQYGRRVGAPITTINLGPIAGGGMAAATSEIETTMAQGGLRLLVPEAALDVIAGLAGGGLAQKIVADVDWTTFRQLHEMSGQRPLLELIEAAASAAIEPVSGVASALLRQIQQAPAGEHVELLMAHVQAEVGRVLKLDPSQRPDPEQGFFDMGMDSLMVLDLKNRLQKSLGYTLPSTLPFEYPTIEALTTYLADRLLAARPSEETVVSRQASAQPDDLAAMQALTEDEIKQLIDAELEMLIDE